MEVNHAATRLGKSFDAFRKLSYKANLAQSAGAYSGCFAHLKNTNRNRSLKGEGSSSERYCCDQGIRPKQLTDGARQRSVRLRRWLPERDIVVADSSYSALDLLPACQVLATPITLITRLRLEAAFYKPAPPRHTGQLGRPRRKGDRLPRLAATLKGPKTSWQRLKVNGYDGQVRSLEIASDTALWFHYANSLYPFVGFLIRDPKGSFEPQALLATGMAVEP